MAKLTCRSAFISDVHLGTPDCKAAYLLDFLRNVDCERLYLVGDIVDLEALAKRHWWHPDHTAVLAEFVALAARGVEVIYIPGNHDCQMRGLVGSSIAGVRVELDAIHEGADGRRYRNRDAPQDEEADHQQQDDRDDGSIEDAVESELGGRRRRQDQRHP